VKPTGVGFAGVAHWYTPSIIAQTVLQMPNAKIVAASDDHKPRLKFFCDQFGIKTSYDDCESLFKDPNVDVVVVAPTTNLHEEVAVKSAEAGKHVICNKPIARTLKEADNILRAANRNKVKLTMPYLARFLASNTKIKGLLEKQAIGEPKIIETGILAPLPWIGGPKEISLEWFCDPNLAAGGGFIDEAVFLVDLARWLLKSEVKEVTAEVRNLIHTELKVEDYGKALLEFDEAVGYMETGWVFPAKHHFLSSKFSVIGTDGEIVVDESRRPSIAYFDGRSEDRVFFDVLNNYFDGSKSFLTGFLEAVQNDQEPNVTGNDGRASLEVCLAAYKSAKEKRPVRLLPGS
jgi:UDP-N-acetylglucosamine 3-dehydrogenase